MKKKIALKRSLIILICLAVVGTAVMLIINGVVKSAGKDRIISVEDATKLEDIDCVIVLGCQVKDDGSLSGMLKDRMWRALELYEAEVAPKLLMSGDHGREDYDEVGAMKNYAVENGVPSENVFMDHAGFSTYETMYRAKEIFESDKVVIVTQEYHLYRALYIAEQLGIEAYGGSSDLHNYAGQTMRECREILARCKDWAMCIFKPEPKYLGEAIPVSGNGDLTNDK